MKINRTSTAVCLLSLATSGIAAACVGASADDWLQWNGPNRNNIATETGWVAEGAAKTAWSRMVGLGYSNVVVGSNRLYTVGFSDERQEDTVFCLRPDDGEIIWSQSYPAKKWAKFHGGGSNSTPTIDGEKVYVFNREGEFRCFDAATGEIHWKKDIRADYDVTLPTWGFAASPLIVDDKIILNAGRAIAFDRSSGEEVWQSENYGHAYSTPVEFENAGRSLIAMFTGYGLIVLERADGSEVAKYEWKTRSDINPATPVIIDDRIFISSGYNHGCAMLRLSGNSLTPAWENKDMKNQMTGCVFINDHLFGFDASTLTCMNLDGSVAWAHRGLGQGALSGAGDRLLIASAKGQLVVAEASGEGFVPISEADVHADGGVHWTTPVLSNGRIYIRSSKGSLSCRDHRGPTVGQ